MKAWGKKVALYSILIILSAYSLAPIVWLVDSGLMPDTEISSIPPHWIPQKIELWRFQALLFGTRVRATSTSGGRAQMWGGSTTKAAEMFRVGLFNSIVIALASMGICVLLASIAGYAFARIKFRGSSLLFLFILGCTLLPPIAVVMSLYLVWNTLGLIDTRWALILTTSGFNLPLMVWVGMSFFKALPIELEEAGKIDGCSSLQLLMRITLPLCAPGIVAIGIIAFMWAWNDFFFANTFANSLNALTAPALIGQFSTMHSHEWAMMSAASVVTLVVPVIVAVIFQRYMVRGLVEGAVKH